MRYYYLLLISAVFSLTACTEPFDLNGEWSDITIVYGVLNPTDTAHYIKINKAFLGDANAYEMAKQADSIQYATELNVRLVEYKMVSLDGATDPYLERNWEPTGRPDIVLYRTNEIKKDTLGENGQEPIFGTQLNYLYKTTEKLSALYKYVLEIVVPGKTEIIKAETFIIGNFYVEDPRLNNPATFNSPIHLENYVRPVSTDWKTATYGKVYEILIRFNYLEILGTDTSYEHIDINYGSQITDNLRLPNDFKGTDMSLNYGGADFYINVGQKIQEKPNVKRKALGLDFIYSIGGSELNTYVSSSTSVGIGQTSSRYTNIENGEGIFASRLTYIIPNKEIYGMAIDSLAYGYYTKHLNFANFQGVWRN